MEHYPCGHPCVPRNRGTKECKACLWARVYAKDNPYGLTDRREIADARFIEITKLRDCKGCGKTIPEHRRYSAIFCSKTCRQKTEKARLRGVDNKKAAWEHVQRVNGATEIVQRKEIAERDLWVCYLCREPIPTAAIKGDPDYLNIDHVFPVSLGGRFEPVNYGATHARCNVKKGNKPDEASYDKFKDNLMSQLSA